MAALQLVVSLILSQGVVSADSRVAVADGKQNVSLDEILRANLTWRSSITSLRYSGEIEGRVLETPKGVFRHLRRRFAAADGHRFSETQHLWEGMSWEDDLKWTRVWMRPKKVTWLSVVNRISTTSTRYSDVTTNPKLADTNNDLYLDCSGWWPVPSVGDDSAPATALHKVLQHQDISLIDGDATLDGQRCVILGIDHSSGAERLWLDRERRYVLLKRHRRNEKTGTELVIENDDFREVVPGIVLPWKVFRRVRRFASGPDDGAVLTQSTLHITQLSVNETSSDQFAADLPPGTIIYDDDTREFKVLPGGRDEVLNSVIRISSKIPYRNTMNSGMLRRQGAMTLGYAAAIGSLLGFLSFFIVERRNRGLKKSTPNSRPQSSPDEAQ